MIRIFLDRLYLFAGFAAGAFLLAIFVLMMLLSAGMLNPTGRPAESSIIRTKIASRNAPAAKPANK